MYMHTLHWFAGVIMGCMQIPVVLSINAPLGSSRSYCTILSCVMTPTGMTQTVPYFKKILQWDWELVAGKINCV